ncbi:MAG: class II aldolase/adducin family protein [Candidatus Desulfofervidus auxilii]|nr:class II aldolase/adducin family protein [Candidatus Desulfofervidus auxilii]
MNYEKEKEEIIFWGRKLYERGLVCGSSGNISKKVNDKILITAHNSYLGFLEKEDILILDRDGKILEGDKKPTSEIALHLAIHKNFSEKIVIHAHSPYTVYYFQYFKILKPLTFEEKFYLGKIPVIPQNTPTVTDILPVIDALKKNNIVVLKNHGIVAIGNDFKSTFSLIELLEINAKLSLITQAISQVKEEIKEERHLEKCKLFSKEHISSLVDIINNDETVQSLGKTYNLTTILCVRDEKEAISFYYEKGKIIKVKNDEENAEFIFSTKREIWKQVFNGEIDPFVAFNQGKIKLKGDFNKLSKWFPVFERTFELWKKVAVD